MGVFTFVCRNGGGEWCAKQIGDSEKQVDETSAGDVYSLQRRLVQAAASLDSSGGVQSSFSLVTPDSAVFQVIIGGGSGGAFIGAGAASAGPAAAAGAGAAAAAEDKKEEDKKEEKEESDDDMGFSLFD
ncbi:60S acidic ribosomal protein P3 [Rhynchospora pubera]|uniref:60S acidic ribosomal protein P3 n=1 Tax=Rhynchospora pubera TaxID=906938 RepID=A0AAV8HAZ7_9POAL|nr:60S acidic ribosomal protein P3 [Rhynchospora pubera]KAJ4813850.1 60S acidic ribosomal protein P3 [Rhynchospora pubera]